ncbi:MAG: ATP-binding protein [Formivibrio sp.]|nr:ATP-binding protein [Formivibrio sp.]
MNDMRITFEQAQALAVQAAKVFQPRTPISTQELFAGRWQEITALADAVGQPGLHIVIHGERGVGKTSLANVVRPIIRAFDTEGGTLTDVPPRLVIKVNANSGDTFSSVWDKMFRDIAWQDDHPTAGLIRGRKSQTSIREAFGLDDKLTVDEVRRVLSHMPGSVFIIDEFDRAAKETSQEFTDLVKALSDFEIDCTVVVVGVSETVDQLIADHASISRSLTQIHLPRMQAGELREILAKSEKTLSVKFSDEAANLIVHLSQGLPHYTHLIGLHSVRTSALKGLSKNIGRKDVFLALKEAVKQAQQTVAEKHSKATHSTHKEALFRHVLLACALTAALSHDSLGYFNQGAVVEPLSKILKKDVEFATFSNHLSEFCQEKRGAILERDGQPRSYRFRFRDPLLVPFTFMDATATDLLNEKQLADMLERSL